MGRARRSAVLAVAAAMLGVATSCGTAAGTLSPPLPAAASAPPPPTTLAAPPPPAPARITYPAAGGGRWTVAPAQRGPAAGESGRRLRYRVAVERDIRGLPIAAFADTVTATLADPRGWTAGGRWRLLRVGPGSPHDFTIFLATPATRDRLCTSRDGYTSCRNGDSVVLNVARWVKGAPDYGASLATYRRYLVNHEVGHRLGNGHERCPGRGRPAPLMQQQTLGLHGCTANPWPYLNGKRYAGRSGTYRDQVPPRDRGQP
jgi:hypothetical protein